MSDAKTNECHKEYIFDHMTTEELEEIIAEDMNAPEHDKLDENMILRITEALAERKNEFSAEEGLRAFKEKHQKYLTSDISFYDIEGEGFDPAEISQEKKKNTLKIFPRAASKAAGVIIALLAVSLAIGITAYAFDIDIWETVMTVTDETFSIVHRKNNSAVTSGFKALLEENGIDGGWVPGYLPDGCEEVEIVDDSTIEKINFRAQYRYGDSSIFIAVRKSENPESLCGQYEIDKDSVERFDYKGMSFYIMSNYEKYKVVYTAGNIEANVSGVDSRETIIKIIKSLEIKR